jgi:hypothetical protein
MKKLFCTFFAALVLSAAFVASPFVAAWSIREAIRTGNSDVLETKLEWDTVRETLRASLVEIATGIPEASPVSAQAPKPGFWQGIKNGMSRRAIDNLVAVYVTPGRLPQLFTLRQFYRDNVSHETAAVEALPWHTRVMGFWSRIKRAEFHSPGAFEIEMIDRNDPARHYVGLLRLRGLEWKLTELRMRMVPATDPA